MQTPHERFNETFVDLVREAASHDLHSEDSTIAMKNLETFSKVRPPEPIVELELTPEPTTVWGKFKLGTARVWDNETTRVVLKAGGAFAGVWYVAHATIQKDHVLERQAMQQANQRNS